MRINRYILLLPSIGILVFLILSLYVCSQYPGGSYMDVKYIGFDWTYNFWCDIMRPKAYNGGEHHTYRIAILALVLLCISCIGLFLLLPRLFLRTQFEKPTKFIAISAMSTSALVVTPLHNEVIWLSGILSMIPALWVFYHFYMHREKTLFYFGLLAIILLALNFIIFALDRIEFIIPLALLEKYGLAIFITWLWLINWKIFKTSTESTG